MFTSQEDTIQGCHLPQELIDHIIDYLRDDSITLRSCALVARAWSASAQYHQFRERMVAEETLDAFSQLVSSRPPIATCIQELCLFTRSRTASRDTEPRALVAPLNQLSLLHTLKLWGIVLASHVATDGPLVHYDGTRLRHLEFGAVQTSTEDFLDTLAIFSHTQINRLRIQSCVVLHTSDNARECPLPSSLRIPWKVGALQIALGSHDFLLSLLGRVLDTDELHSLDCGGDLVGRISRPELDTFMEKFGHSLRHVRWDVCSLYLLDPTVRIASLRHCTSLRSIHLYLNGSVHHEHVHLFPFAILSHLPPSLRILKLGFFTDRGWTDTLGLWLGSVQWPSSRHGREDPLTGEFVRLNLAHIEQVRIVHELPGSEPLAEPEESGLTKDQRYLVECVLPRLRSKGMLRYETGPC